MIIAVILSAAVGLIIYGVLRWRRRRDLAWMTVPVMIVVYGALMYVPSRPETPTPWDLEIDRMSLIYGAAGADQAYSRTLVGVEQIAGDPETYDLILPAGVMARPLLPDLGYDGPINAIVDEAGPFAIRRVQRNHLYLPGQLRIFLAEAAVPNLPITGTLTLVVTDPPRITGSITNQSSVTLNSTKLLVGETPINLGELAPGRTIHVDEPLSLYQPGPLHSDGSCSNLPHIVNIHGAFLRALATCGRPGMRLGQGATLVGWSEHIPWEVSAVGRNTKTSDLAGYLIQLPLTVAAE